MFRQSFICCGLLHRYAVYAANCINKDKPQLHCNGKCQLQKKLDENNNKDKQNAEKKNEASSNIFSSKSFFAFVETLLNIQDKQKFFTYNFRIPINDSFQFFHPPQHFHVI